MSMLMKIAWRNIWRQSRRTWITIWAMALGVSLTMACVAWIDGMFQDGFDLLVRQTIGHVQVHHPDYPKRRALYDSIDGTAALVDKLSALPEVKAASGRVFGFGLLAVGKEAAGGQLIGVIPDDEAATSSIDESVLPGGRNGTLKIEILDGAGAVVATPLGAEPVLFVGPGTVEVLAPWAVGAALPGPYLARATYREEGSTLVASTALDV